MDPAHEAVLDRAFGLLAQGAADAASPFRNLTLGTLAPDGAVGLRIMVLRRFLPGPPAVEFHTDARSPKMSHLRHSSRVSVLGWDPAPRIQMRLAGEATILGAADTEAIWQALPLSTRGTYAVTTAPTTPIAEPAQARRAADPAAAQAVFRVIRVRIVQLEWLHLAPIQHQRARFTWAAHGVQATWLVP